MSVFLLRPATILFFCVVVYVLYRIFVSLLNSRRFARRIDEITNPNETQDLVGRTERVFGQVEEAITTTTEEIKSLKDDRKSLKNLRGNRNEG